MVFLEDLQKLSLSRYGTRFKEPVAKLEETQKEPTSLPILFLQDGGDELGSPILEEFLLMASEPLIIFRTRSGKGVAQEAKEESLQLSFRAESLRLIHEDEGVNKLLDLPYLKASSELGLDLRELAP
jgi:hypothetical protein